MTCGGVGSMGFGSGPFGAGPLSAFSSVTLETFNTLLVNVSGPFYMSDPATSWDLLNPDLWSLTASWPADGALIQYVGKVDADTLRIVTDRLLTPDSNYVLMLAVENAKLTTGASSSTYCGDFGFRTRKKTFLVLQNESGASKGNRYDLANPFSPADAPRGKSSPLGTLQVDDRGDLQNDSGSTYLRKRVLRRATSLPGDWLVMPSYGFGLPVKGKIMADLLRKIQQRSRAQVLLEPDVSACLVEASSPSPGIVLLNIKVKDDSGRSENLTATINLSQG